MRTLIILGVVILVFSVFRKEPLPTWGMAHEQQLKAMMYACNANNWDSWENLADQCDSEPEMVDAR